MTIEWMARIGLLLWFVLTIAWHVAGLKPRGGPGLIALNALAEFWMVVTLVWAGFFL